jgi:hypothetical protein
VVKALIGIFQRPAPLPQRLHDRKIGRRRAEDRNALDHKGLEHKSVGVE